MRGVRDRSSSRSSALRRRELWTVLTRNGRGRPARLQQVRGERAHDLGAVHVAVDDLRPPGRQQVRDRGGGARGRRAPCDDLHRDAQARASGGPRSRP